MNIYPICEYNYIHKNIYALLCRIYFYYKMVKNSFLKYTIVNLRITNHNHEEKNNYNPHQTIIKVEEQIERNGERIGFVR